MKRLAQQLLAGVALSAVIAAGASAHRMWILPSTFTLSGETQWITVDAAVSNDLFFPNHVPLRLDAVHVTAPDGAEVEIANGATGEFRSTFDVRLDQQGTYRIAETGSLYFASWTDEAGERQRQRGSREELAEAGLMDRDDVAVMHSARRVETYVTLGAPTTGVFEAPGEGLALVPVTHPNDVYVGEEATFRFVLDGAPAAGLEVEIVRGEDRYRDNPGALSVTTDEDGAVSFTPDIAGRYWLSTRLGGPRGPGGPGGAGGPGGPGAPGADRPPPPPPPTAPGEAREMMSYALTFEALAL